MPTDTVSKYGIESVRQMMSPKPYTTWKLAEKYLRYLFTAGNGKGHGIHSPFVYSLIRDVFNDRNFYYAYRDIEALRTRLLNDKTAIQIQDYGAGAHRSSTVKEITRRTSKSPHLAKLLFRLCNYFQPASVVELGTSMGISTAYLAAGHLPARVYSLEGAPEVANIAQQNLNRLHLRNVELITGNFDEQLQPLLKQLNKVDLVYIDGNHRFEPTVRYFEQLLPHIHEKSVLIFDDIHWSSEMEAAWSAIKTVPSVRCTVDLFFIGLVFFLPSFKEQQHFTIRY